MSVFRLHRVGIVALLFAGVWGTGGTPRLNAQDGAAAGRERGERASRGAAAGVRDRFGRASPQPGEPLPDLSAYDADGRPIQLRRTLAGHYSVLVFGCLT